MDALPSLPFLIQDPDPKVVDTFRDRFGYDGAWQLHRSMKRLRPVRQPGKGESAVHALIKREAAAAASAAGWNVTAEARGKNWRADLLAQRDGQSVAIEVQLSASSLAQYRQRQTRYEAQGVRCVWLCSYYPKGYVPDPALVLLRVSASQDGELVIGLPRMDEFDNECLDAQSLPLADGVKRLLGGDVVFRTRADVTQHVELVAWRETCWRCRLSNSHAWDTRYHGRSSCGLSVDTAQIPIGYESRLASEIRNFAQEGGIAASIRPRFSKTVGRAYPSFGCLDCDAIFGDWFLKETMMEIAYDPPIWGVLAAPAVQVKHAHWCVGACCDPADQPTDADTTHVKNDLWLPI
jgi:hypothetical protein